MFSRGSIGGVICALVAACGGPRLSPPRTAELPQASVVEPQTPPPILVGPFMDIADQAVTFAAPYLRATLPPRTRSIDEIAAARLDAYNLYDDLRSPGEKLVYEVDACLFVLTSRRTTQLSPRAVFDASDGDRLLGSLGLVRYRTTDTNLVAGGKRLTDAVTRLVVFQRDYYAVETDVSTKPLSEQSFDEDPANDDDWRERPDADERQRVCRDCAESWLATTLSSLRANTTPPLETEVGVVAPSGDTYSVTLPEGTTGYTGEWYHGAESYLAVRTEYGEPECGSVLVSESESDYLFFEPPPGRAATLSLFGTRLSVVPDTDQSDEGCQSRVVFIPRRDSSHYHHWLMRMRGDDETLAPLLEAMGREARRQR